MHHCVCAWISNIFFAYKHVPIVPVSLFVLSFFECVCYRSLTPPVYNGIGHSLNTFPLFFSSPFLVKHRFREPHFGGDNEHRSIKKGDNKAKCDGGTTPRGCFTLMRHCRERERKRGSDSNIWFFFLHTLTGNEKFHEAPAIFSQFQKCYMNAKHKLGLGAYAVWTWPSYEDPTQYRKTVDWWRCNLWKTMWNHQQQAEEARTNSKCSTALHINLCCSDVFSSCATIFNVVYDLVFVVDD